MKRRENTFRVDYSTVPKKPTFEELHRFVGETLGLKQGEVVRIQPSISLGCAFVKVITLDIAQRIVKEHDNAHELEIDGKSFKLRITLEDGAVEVKLNDLSEDVSDAMISEYLREYGDVISIHEQMWESKYLFGGIPSGIRVARMFIKKNIPSFIIIDGETTAVKYYGQQQTCRHCSEFSHSGISCIANKKLLAQKSLVDEKKKSYADMAKQKTRPAKPLGSKPTTKKLPGPKQSTADTEINKQPEQLTFKTPLPPTSTQCIQDQDTLRQKYKESDGNETDISSESLNSRRRSSRCPPGKKQRRDDDADQREVEFTL